MKALISVLGIFLSSVTFSQIPAGYYTTANGLTGDSLKTALYNIIKGHTEFPYTSTSTDVWDILKQTDKDPNDSNNVILLYTGWSIDGPLEYDSGNGWSREHVWSKSHGGFANTLGAGTDVHHIRPSDIEVNSAKNNRWFDTCSVPYLSTGCFTGATDWVWQPRDSEKGDVARMIFYMATRYEGGTGEPDLKLIDYLPADNNTSDSVYAKLSTMLLWNIEDPVDDWERNRNDIIYYDYQNNRNPFIDHPEYAELIWSSAVGNEEILNGSNIIIYPNPTAGIISIDLGEIKTNLTVTLTNVLGEVVISKEIMSTDFFTIKVDTLKGIYFLTLETESGEIVTKKIFID